jgi:hypothetical protein
MNQDSWKILETFVSINSPWLTLIGEKIQDNHGKVLDYWRVEKPDSVIIITLQNNSFILPQPMHRPGIGKVTLDFPGGRLPKGENPSTVAVNILERELGITEDGLISLNPINDKPWAINSSFSNQKLYGFLAEINPLFRVESHKLGAIYNNDKTGIKNLLQDLTCLQCRGLLLELLSNLTSRT